MGSLNVRNFHKIRFHVLPALVLILSWASACRCLAETYPMRPMGAGERAVEEGKVGFDQRLGQKISKNLTFLDETAKQVQLSQIAAGRPLILIMAYYECPSLCTLVLNGAFSALNQLTYKAGRDYALAIVSINSKEEPAMASVKKKSYVNRYPGLGEADSIRFLTGNEAAITRLASEVGFRYAYDPASQEYIHPGGMVLINPDGSISRYLFGVGFEARDLRLALTEASQGRVGNAIDKFLLYCYRYDSGAGTYTFAIYKVLQGLGVLTIMALAGTIFYLIRLDGRKRKRALPIGGEA